MWVYASSFITHVTSDVTIIFQSPTLVTFPSNSGAPIETLASTSVGAVSMSIQAAKDLAKLLENNVKAYEDMFGEVTTPWMELQKKQAEGNDS